MAPSPLLFLVSLRTRYIPLALKALTNLPISHVRGAIAVNRNRSTHNIEFLIVYKPKLKTWMIIFSQDGIHLIDSGFNNNCV